MDSIEINLQGDYEKAFPARLRKLMDDGHISQQKLADHLGLKNRQSVASYCNGRSAPDLSSIVKIASIFGVSTDYLLGATDDPAPRPSAVDDLGLSPKAVQYLRILHELTKKPPYDTRISLLSYFFENSQFDYMLALCERYVRLMGTTVDQDFRYSSDYTFYDDALKPHGYVISPPDIQANALFSEQIVNLLRTVLDERAKHTGGSQVASTPPPEDKDTPAAGTPTDAAETPPEGE